MKWYNKTPDSQAFYPIGSSRARNFWAVLSPPVSVVVWLCVRLQVPVRPSRRPLTLAQGKPSWTSDLGFLCTHYHRRENPLPFSSPTPACRVLTARAAAACLFHPHLKMKSSLVPAHFSRSWLSFGGWNFGGGLGEQISQSGKSEMLSDIFN